MEFFKKPKKQKPTPKSMRAQVAAVGTMSMMMSRMDPINGFMGTITAGLKSNNPMIKDAVILALGELLREATLNYESAMNAVDTFSGELLMTVDVGIETEKDKELLEHLTNFLAALMAKHEMGCKASFGMVRSDTDRLIDIVYDDTLKKPKAEEAPDKNKSEDEEEKESQE